MQVETNLTQFRLIQEAFKFYRKGNLAPQIPPSLLDISQLQDAVSIVSSVESFGRVLLQSKKDSQVPVSHLAGLKVEIFNAGLGSKYANAVVIQFIGNISHDRLPGWTWKESHVSLTRLLHCVSNANHVVLRNRMVQRGARHFIFLSRSGAEKSEAAAVLKQLEEYSQKHNTEVTFQVIRGDVSVRSDVDKAIAAAHHPIRGVIQAAAVFQVSTIPDQIDIAG